MHQGLCHPGSLRLNRFKITFLRYMGGKSHLIKTLLKLLPPHKCYVEVFGGGAQLLFAKEPSQVEIYNDVDGRLVNLFRVARDRPEELQRALEMLPYSRRIYREFVRQPVTGDPVEDAARFFYLTRVSFASRIKEGWGYSTVRNHAKDHFSAIDQLGLVAARLRNVQVDELDFRECIKRYDRPWTLFYCDPPYYGGRYYQQDFSEKDHEDLAEILRRVKGKWLLTYNDHPRIRHFYAGYDILMKKLPLDAYLVKNKKPRRKWDQLIIANFRLKRQQQLTRSPLFPNRVQIPGTRPPFKSQRPKIRTS